MHPRVTVSHPGLSPNQLCSDSNPYRPTVPLTFIRYRINIMYKLELALELSDCKSNGHYKWIPII